VVNTGYIGIHGAVETVKTALAAWKKRQGYA